MLQITFSNRLESLLDTLLTALQATPPSVFRTDQIIIPSAAMQRKVDLAMTDRYGISANIRFSFLAQWIWEQIGAVLPIDRSAQMTPPVLAWRLLAIFNDSSFTDQHPRLSGWLAVADPVMRFDLATRTAALLDQYTTYRADWIEQWSQGTLVALPDASPAQIQDQAWQAALWQRVLHDLGAQQQHLTPALLRDLKAAITTEHNASATIHLLCLPTIAPIYLDALRELGRATNLHLYVLNPCREYWFDIVDQKRLTYLAVQGDTQHHDSGNRLLGAWGKQTQAQIDLLFDADIHAIIDDARFVTAPGDTLLAHVQNAVLDLTELPAIELAETDRSIEFHACHSLTRELEVLQDQLLALFAGQQPPLPCDILVVTPNIEDAAALIDTVFGSVPFARRIPYTITGRAASTTNPAAGALLGLLALTTSRITASAVFALLQQPIIGRRFDFGPDELDVIHTWLDQSGIRWGLDATALPGAARCSFDEGLHRLFLGYALPSTVAQPFGGRVPGANIEGGDAEILGRFWLCMQDIRTLQRELGQPRAAADWLPLLGGVLDTFLAPDNAQLDDLDQVRASLRVLNDQLRHAEVAGSISEDVLRAALTALLDESARGGVPTGSVTFAGMSSLRNLPFRIVCAIGLNDGAFPTTNRPAEFDLMPLAPRRGDRQRGSDDRNLFLDLILCARSRLYLSFTGRGIRDNAALPPSVLVADLLDYLIPAIATDANSTAALAAARKRLLVTHPLQPFSTKYFVDDKDKDARLTSANEDYCAALQHALATPVSTATVTDQAGESADESDHESNDESDDDAPSTSLPFFDTALPPPGEEWRTVSVDQLKNFFNNPCRYLLQNRLGLRLREDDATLKDDEPFLPDWLGNQELASRMLPLFEQGMALPDITAMARAGIELPPGPMGDKALQDALGSLQQFADNVAMASTETCLPPHQVRLDFAIDGEDWQLTGAFSDLRPGGLVRSRCDAVRATDYLAGWIDHLVLNARLPAGVSGTTTWISLDGQYQLTPCGTAADTLANMVRLYRQGLSAPLHFFPKSAWAYTLDDAIAGAVKKWFSTSFHEFGEDRHVAYRLALRGVADPLDSAFEDATHAVFGPIMQHLEDDRL
ncbi:exodeoxyribonuclease V subunit gamma [Actimicrobium antarcticum]|uniref:RecBCD enzyme subunit RecC n=1 Tax=Actimicrobium antarcticum TaxID=1051899 RepID=A0ABP7STP6_9BURK